MEQDMIDSTRESIKWIAPVKRDEKYLVTTNGMVWSTKNKQWLKPLITGNGHYQVQLSKERPYIHILMFETFIRPLIKGEVVHHKNRIKTDNRLQNLEVMSRKEHLQLHNKGKSHSCSQQTRQKLKEAAKKRIVTQQWKQRMRQIAKARIGTHHSEQTKRKMSETIRGLHLHHTEDAKHRISEGRKQWWRKKKESNSN